jgi:hypothetical protein
MADSQAETRGEPRRTSGTLEAPADGELPNLRRQLDAPHDPLSVPVADFQLFVKAIEGSNWELTHENCPDLQLLCDKFKFVDLGGKAKVFTDRRTSVIFQVNTVHILRRPATSSAVHHPF